MLFRVACAVPLLIISALVFEANGPTATSLMSLTLPALCLVRNRRVTFALVALGFTFITTRFITRKPLAEVCVNGRCTAGTLWWQRIIDEREATRAGLYLSGHLGSMRGEEFKRFDTLIDTSWKRMPSTWDGVPNALLLSSREDHIETVRVRAKAPTGTQRPAIVFLHGFGGLLSLYVEAISTNTHRSYDVIAPALDPLGAWWTPRGMKVIEQTLDQLPPDVDRQRVFLIGLSNGGVGASAVLQHPGLAKRFAGIVLLSGIGDLSELKRIPENTRVLIISGTIDPRFQSTWVADQVSALRRTGADTTWKTFEADHFLLLTHAADWAEAFDGWAMKARHCPSCRSSSAQGLRTVELF